MSTITARSIRRRNPNRAPASTLANFAMLLTANGIAANYSGRFRGARVFAHAEVLGFFRVATFRHPTKKATAGRYGSVTWMGKAAA